MVLEAGASLQGTVKDAAGDGTLVLAEGLTSATFDEGPLNGGEAADDLIFTTQSAGQDIEITAPCFCLGTHIATMSGSVAMEDLAIGDLVRTVNNGAQAIRWIGTRSYNRAFIAGNRAALPVKIFRHALGFNLPARDLRVSSDHALYEGDVLVHAVRFVNGVSITQDESVERVESFHDTGCRARFSNTLG